MKRKIIAVVLAATVALGLGACTAADTASVNVSTAADNFEVQRLIVGINGITGEVIFSAEGRCSITRDGDLVVICKHGEDDYRKHFVGLSDNVTWVSTQLAPIDVSEYRTRIILRPTTILPDFDLSLGF